jgi:DNA-binding transcriptional regulator YbjK
MRQWIINELMILPEDMDAIEKEAKASARNAKERAWKAFANDVKKDQSKVTAILETAIKESTNSADILRIKNDLVRAINPTRLETMRAAKKAIRYLVNENGEARQNLTEWLKNAEADNFDRYSSHVYSTSEESALNVDKVGPVYSDSSPLVDGFTGMF